MPNQISIPEPVAGHGIPQESSFGLVVKGQRYDEWSFWNLTKWGTSGPCQQRRLCGRQAEC
jgi:hypothetical protein